jgi:hypothetical protein
VAAHAFRRTWRSLRSVPAVAPWLGHPYLFVDAVSSYQFSVERDFPAAPIIPECAGSYSSHSTNNGLTRQKSPFHAVRAPPTSLWG